MTNRPNTQQGGQTGVFAGSLKRRLATVPLARLSSTAEGSDFVTQTSRLLLKNLMGDLNVQIAVGVVSTVTPGTGFTTPLRPEDYPAAGTVFGTVQLTPINNFPDANGKAYLRPVFQNPALPQQQNNPLPQDIPFGWEADSRCDEVEIEVVLTAAGWAGEIIDGLVVCQVTIEYNGEWWDVDAINFALGQVTLVGAPSDPPIISTIGGG